MATRKRRPSASAASKAAATLSKLGAAAGGRARAEKLTPERRLEIANEANAAQGKAEAKPWWKRPRRRAGKRYNCVLEDGCKIEKGAEYFDGGSTPRRRACLACVKALALQALPSAPPEVLEQVDAAIEGVS